MSDKEEKLIRKAYELLLNSQSCDYNNDSNVEESRLYIDYVFSELKNGRIPKNNKSAGFPMAGE